MHNLAPLVSDLTIMLGLAAIVVVLFQRIHQPVVLGYLVAGMIVGPHTPPHSLISDINNIQILSQLGVIFLMFSLGLEFSFQKLTRVGFSASIVGIIEVILMLLLGYLTGLMMGWSHYNCLFLGAALSISSTTIIVKAIEELRLKSKRFAELIFGVLVVEDLLAILLLVALSTLVQTQSIISVNMLYAAGKLILVVAAWFLVGYFIVPTLFRKISIYINQETLTILSVALCLLLVTIAAQFNYSTALGAFIMGSILAETILIHRIEKLIHPIRDIFAAVFFVSVGMLIDPTIIMENWQLVILISIVTIVGKLLTTSLGALLTGQSLQTSVRVGFSMAQVGEFSFIIAGLGVALGVTNDKLYPLIVAVSGITTFTTPYLIRLSGYVATAIDKSLPRRAKYLLNSYSAWVYRSQSRGQSDTHTRKTFVRLLVNGLLVAIIFTLVHYLAMYRYHLFDPTSKVGNTLLLLLSLGLASSFIWGMLFSYKHTRQLHLNELTPAAIIVWIITFAEVAALSLVYFHTWITVILFFSIGILFFVLAFRQLERSYLWFEDHLIGNLQQISEKTHYSELAPWDTHLVEIDLEDNPNFVGKSLNQCQIRQRFEVNIVAICRGGRIITAPRGNEKLHARDTLIVLGNDDQLEKFRNAIEIANEHGEIVNVLSNFTLKPILIDANHPWLGQTIRDSQLREHVNGIVAGLERRHYRILNPTPDTVLEHNDIILVVGEVKKLKRLKKMNKG